jgi:plasmid maintenance system antidote protein VapI
VSNAILGFSSKYHIDQTQHHANQVQLEKAGVVAQSTLSQILAGKRGISKGVAKKLGVFFGVSSVVFL